MRPLRILHVEDNEEDWILFEKACEVAGLRAEFFRVWDGCEAVDYLKGEEKFAERAPFPQPDLIVLDLGLPRMDGFDFLRWLRHDSPYASLPVLIFTISSDTEDRERAMAEGATGYFIKPKAFESVVRLSESLRTFQADN